jgi:hypothetical protein
MDGMDGRGQVIVIGATNRPDAIDSALRRPGRFDREFYFPLPSLPDRQSILRIHTHQWEGWEKGSERGEVMRKKLAEMTKGYGGADLRMLCTEAALNAVQRTFPQIYKSTDRLLVQPEKIKVQPRDFMGAIKSESIFHLLITRSFHFSSRLMNAFARTRTFFRKVYRDHSCAHTYPTCPAPHTSAGTCKISRNQDPTYQPG